MHEIYIKSTIDKTMQPSLFKRAEGCEKRPLLVGLHTWSCDRENQVENMLPYAEKYNFHLLLPEFRGPNLISNPDCTKACASLSARQDIIDAIDYICERENVDEENIFLLGLSGGGHMAMMMAGYAPLRFKSIGAFVPISNLKVWAEENQHYSMHVKACCGGREEEMLSRSPINCIDEIAKANLKIFHGKYDTVVPVTQSINFYNELYKKHPDCRVFLDVFDGGHEIDFEAAFYWLLSGQKKNKEAVTG